MVLYEAAVFGNIREDPHIKPCDAEESPFEPVGLYYRSAYVDQAD